MEKIQTVDREGSMEQVDWWAGGVVQLSWRAVDGSRGQLRSVEAITQSGPVTITRRSDSGTGHFKIEIETTTAIILERCRWIGRIPVRADARIFANGYQSWTHSRETGLAGRTAGMGWLGRLLEGQYHFSAYGDYKFAPSPGGPGSFTAWTWLDLRCGDDWELYGSCDENPGFTAFRLTCPLALVLRSLLGSPRSGLARLSISRDIEGLELPAGGRLNLLDIGHFTGSPTQAYDDWFAAQAIQARPAAVCSGWTSWYKYYNDISETKIAAVLGPWAKARERWAMTDAGGQPDKAGSATYPDSPVVGTVSGWLRHLAVFQIDDGWQSAVGDWLDIRNDRFPSGLKNLAATIRQAGLLPGLWLAPFAAVPGSRLAREHPEWLVRDKAGLPILCGSNWGGFYGLDLEITAARDWLRQVFATVLDDWGFGLVKLDFLYAVCLQPRHGKSRGQLMAQAMDFIRECVGDRQVLACGVPLAAAFGRVEYCRIGPDVGLDWDGGLAYRFLHRERVSTKNALDNTQGRRLVNGRAFLNDPDVWIGRNDPAVRLTAAQKAQLHRINLEHGGLVFTSDDWDEIPELWRHGD